MVDEDGNKGSQWNLDTLYLHMSGMLREADKRVKFIG